MKMDRFARSGGGLTPALLLYHLHPSFFRQEKLLSRDNRLEIKNCEEILVHFSAFLAT